MGLNINKITGLFNSGRGIIAAGDDDVVFKTGFGDRSEPKVPVLNEVISNTSGSFDQLDLSDWGILTGMDITFKNDKPGKILIMFVGESVYQEESQFVETDAFFRLRVRGDKITSQIIPDARNVSYSIGDINIAGTLLVSLRTMITMQAVVEVPDGNIRVTAEGQRVESAAAYGTERRSMIIMKVQ